jgi:predicted metal-dependent phosphoesterase TrpH
MGARIQPRKSAAKHFHAQLSKDFLSFVGHFSSCRAKNDLQMNSVRAISTCIPTKIYNSITFISYDCGIVSARNKDRWRRPIARMERDQEREMIDQISKADLHMHTTASDGTATVPELLEYVARIPDLRVIAITDHDSIASAKEAARLACQFGIDVIMGEEISTADGHLLALFIDTFLPPRRPAAETIAAIHAQGGLAIAPHPFDRSVPSLGRLGLQRAGWDFDAIEGFNAGVIWSQRGCNGAAQRAAAAIGLPAIGGSDAHTLATVGLGYTLFPGTSANDLYRAIRAKQASWGGSYWGPGQYIDMGRRIIRQHSLWGALNLAAAGAGLVARQD